MPGARFVSQELSQCRTVGLSLGTLRHRVPDGKPKCRVSISRGTCSHAPNYTLLLKSSTCMVKNKTNKQTPAGRTLKPPRGSALTMETPGLGHPLALGSRSAGADEDQAAKPSGLPPWPPTHPHRRLPLTGTLCCGKQGKRQSPGLITAAGAALLTNDSAAPASPPLQATGTRAPPKSLPAMCI